MRKKNKKKLLVSQNTIHVAKKKPCNYDHARGMTEDLNESKTDEEGNKLDEHAQGVRENVNNKSAL